ncbi:Calcium-dependent protein kinase 2 [Symbiodinium microadriaticum]|uniref:Calcium-dependent protein kinase 2 n=1 Tax=Symbiodinium microadriaticum TaxID=2951 RepID=A0A1Q9C5T0_SYMMI|nr:Calcium-dependent protein kinase 2 [Symbiodinium microadriaticum]
MERRRLRLPLPLTGRHCGAQGEVLRQLTAHRRRVSEAATVGLSLEAASGVSADEVGMTDEHAESNESAWPRGWASVLGAGVAFLTMPGHFGVYAAESLSAASAPESAYTDDRHFAYAFGSYEEARAAAGTLVAEDWAAVRASDQPVLLGDLARAVEVPPRAPREKQQLQDEAPSEEHIEALAEAFFSLGALRPKGQMTLKLEEEWRAALRRRAVGLLHILCAAVGGLLDFKSWGVIPQSAPARVAEVQPRFNLPPAIPLPLASENRMPRQLRGKRLSAALRDGKTSCAAFQRDRCIGGDGCEAGRHRCAVMLQSGRVCGGWCAAQVFGGGASCEECTPKKSKKQWIDLEAKPAAGAREPASPPPGYGVEDRGQTGGELWLSGLPTRDNMQALPNALQLQVQIYKVLPQNTVGDWIRKEEKPGGGRDPLDKALRQGLEGRLENWLRAGGWMVRLEGLGGAGGLFMICRADLIQRLAVVQAAYELKASLGRGGVGRVVQVAELITDALNMRVSTEGFEVSLMSKLDHPNVVRLFETFVEESQGQIHLVMELCAGALPSYAREFWPPLEEAAGAVIMQWQLLGAVNYLHKQSLSHGDICPANVLWRISMPCGHVIASTLQALEVLMLHFDRPPEQNVAQKSYKGLGKGSTFSASVEVTKLIDFGAHAGRRTHDLPSSGLVMRALLGWCSGMKGASLREAPVMKKGQAAVYSEGGLGVPISKAAGELLARFAGSEPDAAFTAEKALCHTWFIRARHGEVPLRKATSKRGAKPEGSTPRSDANGSKEAGSHGKKDKESGRRTRNKETKPRRERAREERESDKKGDGTRSGGRGESSTGSRKHLALGAVEEKPVTAAGWWGSRAELPQNFVARLRAFCNVSSVSRAILLVAADCLEEEALAPLRAAFQRLDGWCPDGLLTVRKDAPKDLDRLLLEAAPRHRDAPCLSQGPDKGCQYQREMDET